MDDELDKTAELQIVLRFLHDAFFYYLLSKGNAREHLQVRSAEREPTGNGNGKVLGRNCEGLLTFDSRIWGRGHAQTPGFLFTQFHLSHPFSTGYHDNAQLHARTKGGSVQTPGQISLIHVEHICTRNINIIFYTFL